jgi:drug/metabolite transporter (DMT)-like permease
MVVLLAVLAALLFALAGAAEQRAAARLLRAPAAARCAACRCHEARGLSAAERAGRRVRQGLRLAGRLVRSPLWLAGWVADGLGFVAQARALHGGSLSVVQPLLVTTLLFSLPLAALGGRRRPGRSDWAGGIAVAAGLALVLSRRRIDAGAAAHQARLLMLGLLVAAAAAALVLWARARPEHRAVPFSIAAGLMFGLGAAFTKVVTGSLAARGIAATAASWPAYALIAVAAAGLVLQQAAFAAGSLPATMTAMTITDPLASYFLGIVGFGERPPAGLASASVTVLGLGLLAAGVVVLARSPLLAIPRAAAGPDSPVPDTPGVAHSAQ